MKTSDEMAMESGCRAVFALILLSLFIFIVLPFLAKVAFIGYVIFS